MQTSRYIFFNAVSLLSIAAYNNTPDAMVTWTDNNRQDKKFLHTVGMLIRDLPIAVRLEGMTVGELFESVKEQMDSCAKCASYPCTLTLDDDLLCSIYQGRLYETPQYLEIFDSKVDIRRNSPGSQNILNIEIKEPDDGLEILLDYAAHRYKHNSMERFAEIYVRTVHRLIEADPDIDAMKLLEV